MNESAFTKIMSVIGGMSLGRVAIVAAVLTGAYYALLFDSGETLIQSIEAAKAQLESENAKKIETQKVLKKEQQMKADVELLAKKFEEIKAQIPLEFLESELRTIVDHSALQNNLKTTRTDRRQTTNRGHAAGTNESLIEQVPLGYEFEGSYDSIAKFVTQISSLEKLIKIGDFELNVRNDFGSKKSKDLVFKVNIIGYKQSLEALKGTKKDEKL